MTEVDYQDSRPSDTIDIPTTFRPTMELTDEIRNTSLADLIKQHKGKPSINDQDLFNSQLVRLATSEEDRKYFEDAAIHYVLSRRANWGDIHIKHVSTSSNLAKVFYLQDLCTFVEFNEEYYSNIRNKQSEEQEAEREKNAQENWDKYQ